MPVAAISIACDSCQSLFKASNVWSAWRSSSVGSASTALAGKGGASEGPSPRNSTVFLSLPVTMNPPIVTSLPLPTTLRADRLSSWLTRARVGVGVGVAVALGVDVAVGVAVGLGLEAGVEVGLGVGLGTGVRPGVGVGVGGGVGTGSDVLNRLALSSNTSFGSDGSASSTVTMGLTGVGAFHTQLSEVTVL